MKIKGDDLIFSSGRKEYANCGLVGLSFRQGEFTISGGYDDGIWPDTWRDDPMSKEDLRELADYMIDLWTEFRGSI